MEETDSAVGGHRFGAGRSLGIRTERSASRPVSLGPWVSPLRKAQPDSSPNSPVLPPATKNATLPARPRALFAGDGTAQVSRSKFYIEAEVVSHSPAKPFTDVLLLEGEVTQGNPISDVTYMCPFNVQVNGELLITNYRLYFQSYDKDRQLVFDVPLGGIKKIEKCGKVGSRGEHSYGIDVFCADMRNLRFACRRDHNARRSLYEMLHRFAFPKSHKMDVFAFDYRATYSSNGWLVYDAPREFHRLGLPTENWVVSRLNENYELCDTYPRVIAVPAKANDEEIRGVAGFRSRRRLPVLSWLDPEGRASITRCSQPLVGVGGKRNKIDERYVERIRDANARSGRLSIMDARPPVNAKANKARGGGYESEDCYPFADIVFLDIHNIHVMRESLRKVKDMAFPDVDNSRWYTNLSSSSWLEHVKCVIAGAVRIVERVHHGRASCFVHCSDGWDRTAQLTALSMLLLDPYYRTLVGFEVLVEKEWLSFGHKFAQRIGHGDDKHSDADRSPIFLQWIDCVWQISKQFPYAFQFNEAFLIFILDHLYSCRFGTFLCNSERERVTQDLKSKTISVWSYVNSRQSQFLNPDYMPEPRQPRVLFPVASLRHLRLWTSYYFRWNHYYQDPERPMSTTTELAGYKAELERELASKTKRRAYSHLPSTTTDI